MASHIIFEVLYRILTEAIMSCLSYFILVIGFIILMNLILFKIAIAKKKKTHLVIVSTRLFLKM